MTNHDRLRQMDASAFQDFLRQVRLGPLMEYVDWEKWLGQEEEAYCYYGCDGLYIPNGRLSAAGSGPIRCRILGDAPDVGRDYKKILIGGRIYYVPSDWVREEVT